MVYGGSFGGFWFCFVFFNFFFVGEKNFLGS